MKNSREVSEVLFEPGEVLHHPITRGCVPVLGTFGTKILGVGCISKEIFWYWDLISARNSGNAKVWSIQQFC